MKAAVTEAYRVFAPYAYGSGDPNGRNARSLGPLEERLLRLTPIREVPAELLAAHAASLATTFGGTGDDDLRALLPRYFEIVAGEGVPLSGWRQDFLRGLARTEYRSRWPSEEADVVDRMLAAMLAAAEARGGADDLATMRWVVAEVGCVAPIPQESA